MMDADSLHASVHCLVLSGVSSPCRRACSAHAFALHFALHVGLPSAPSSGAPITALLAADALRFAVQPVMLAGGSFRLHGLCRCAWRARASAQPFVPPSNVQMSCLEHGWPVAVAVFAGALAACAAAPPGRDCRERKREANAEGKIEGCGTTVLTKPVCTWVWGGTHPRAVACRQQLHRLAGLGRTACRIRPGAMGLAGVSP